MDPSTDTDGEYISNIFIGQKRSGGIQIILNLKPFNCKYLQKIARLTSILVDIAMSPKIISFA